MATSGSSNFSLNAREIVTYALRKIRVLGEGVDPSADQAADAMRELNLMLKGWTKHEDLWRLTEGTVTLLDGVYSYALTPLPSKVMSVRYRDGDRYLPMELMSRSAFYDMPLRTGAGLPTQFYVDYQRAAATLYLWQSLADYGGQTLVYTYLRAFEDIDSLDNDIDVRPEYLEVVGLNLAARLADDYARGGPFIDRIIARAQFLFEEALDNEREDFVQFTPAPYGYY